MVAFLNIANIPLIEPAIIQAFTNPQRQKFVLEAEDGTFPWLFSGGTAPYSTV